jgi:subtilisin family serine protease
MNRKADIADYSESGWSPKVALDLVRLPALMDLTAGSRDLTVALIDGPVALDHPEITAQTIWSLSQSKRARCARPDSFACTHGTYVAGLLHGTRDGGVPGICPGCTLVVRPIFTEARDVTQSAGVPNATVTELALALREVIDNGARVVNLSVGVTEAALRTEPALNEALEQASRRGVIVIAAAGNQSTLGGSAITRHPWVIPVVGCDRHGRVLARSNLGASIGRHGLAAPGHEITSLAASGGHATFSGSSAAVPFVTGTVALLWSVFPRASPAQIHRAVTGRPDRVRSVIPPLLDAWAAYRALAPARMGAIAT